jgi:hypothetical protein
MNIEQGMSNNEVKAYAISPYSLNYFDIRSSLFDIRYSSFSSSFLISQGYLDPIQLTVECKRIAGVNL